MLKTHNNTQNTESSSRDVIRGKAFYFLGRREYSKLELRQKLQEKFPDEQEQILEVIQEFENKDWISDVRYAEEMIREKSIHAGWGPMKILQRLKEKGIEKENITEVLENLFPHDSQRERAIRLAKEKWRLLQKKTATQRKAAVQRFLVSRGFPFSIVMEATERLMKE